MEEEKNVIVRVAQILSDLKIPYAIIGGIAVGVLGIPRATADIDILVDLFPEKLPEFIERMKNEGWKSVRIVGSKNNPDFIRVKGRTALWYLDFTVARTDYQKEILKRAKKIRIKSRFVKIAGVEDVIILKLISWRRRDQADVEMLLKVHWKNIDMEYIKEKAREWDVLSRLDEIISDVAPE